ncbi:MAG: aspartyl protease family protein [Candidatus Acidiferrales bacterium]
MPPPPFSAFTIKYAGYTNRIITAVSITAAYDPSNPPTPPPAQVPTSALWDTGATGSSITPSVVKNLGLTPIGSQVVNHFGGTSTKNTYLVNVFLPNSVTIVGVVVTECEETAQFGFILGMEIITKGDFSITNVANQTWVSFRVPSMTGIDYVQEANKMRFAGVGRNDPCPCGKQDAGGKPVKFKKCHGAPV